MNTVSALECTLEAELATVVEFRQRRSAAFKKIRISDTTLLRICSGTKIVVDGNSHRTKAHRGDFLLLRCGETLSIANTVDDEDQYCAEGLVFSSELMRTFTETTATAETKSSIRSGFMSGDFEHAFTAALTALGNSELPLRILVHRLFETLYWLEEFGVKNRTVSSNSTAEQLRGLLDLDVEKRWKAPQAASALGMSEATLRRALRRENTSFSEQLREARLCSALMLTQTTDWPFAVIAAESGFSSQSRLSEAFKRRFDLTPSQLRSKPRSLRD